MNYLEFLESKKIIHQSTGLDISRDKLSPYLFDFQADLVHWALKKGRAALFTMTGTGKTIMQCEWANQVHAHTGGNVLILAPLAVSKQTVRESAKFGIAVNHCRTQEDVNPGINITNYEMLHHFDANSFVGVVLDESAILKSFTSKTRNEIMQAFASTPHKLSCSAVPAPNDYTELANQSDFLGVMTRTEMLAMFFVHDGSDTSKWRLKGHAQNRFWEWMASWAVVMTKPSDLGYENGGYDLPPLIMNEHVVDADTPIDMLFAVEAQTLQERQRARRDTTRERVQKCAEIVNSTNKPFLVWCDLNIESESLRKAIPGSVEVKGSDSMEHKENAMIGFSNGSIRVLVTKPSIAGHGLNWQHCADMAFVGLSDSFEQYFQAVRRCWRFGQTQPVNVHIITSELEGAVKANIERKERDAELMIAEMVGFTKDITTRQVKQTIREITKYNPNIEMIIPSWLRSVAI